MVARIEVYNALGADYAPSAARGALSASHFPRPLNLGGDMRARLCVVVALSTIVVFGCNRPSSDASEPNPTGESSESPATEQEESPVLDQSTYEPDPDDPTQTPADVAAPPANAEVTVSGLASRVLRPGTGTERPREVDTVVVHYAGWTTDGELFDSSYARGQTISFPLNRVISGWTEGLQLMVVGERRRFWIPQDLAYRGQPGAPAGMLVFDVELFEIERAPDPPAVPDDVAGIPSDAETTPSGLASRVVTAGTGDRNPGPTSRVRVHYSGWTTDGAMFDSSVMRGEPATFGLNQVIAGWTEGLQLMVEGETRLLWIPSELAYNNQPGRPAGMLVFEVTLLEIFN